MRAADGVEFETPSWQPMCSAARRSLKQVVLSSHQCKLDVSLLGILENDTTPEGKKPIPAKKNIVITTGCRMGERGDPEMHAAGGRPLPAEELDLHFARP